MANCQKQTNKTIIGNELILAGKLQLKKLQKTKPEIRYLSMQLK